MSVKVLVTYAPSTSTEDKVKSAAHTLTVMGYDIWTGKSELKPGDSITEEVGKALDKATYVIAFIDKDTKSSKWVNWELQEAIKKGKKILPVLVGGAEADQIPDLIRDRYAIRASNYDESVRLIFNEIERDRSVWSKLKEYLANE